MSSVKILKIIKNIKLFSSLIYFCRKNILYFFAKLSLVIKNFYFQIFLSTEKTWEILSLRVTQKIKSYFINFADFNSALS